MDAGQLGRWYDEWAGGLVLYARARWGSAAEDVVQEAFVQLMRQGRRPEYPKAWLYRCVHNAAVSRIRKEQAQRKYLGRLAEVRSEWFEERPGEGMDAAAVEAALKELDGGGRELVVMRIWGELSWREIAEVTGMPTSTVCHRYREALAEIRRRIERCKTNMER